MPNTQWLEILIVAMVAGVLLFRLYSVLGRRTGHEPSPRTLPGPDARRLPQPDARAEQGGSGLLDIQLADNSFDTDAFLSGARSAYQLISTSFEKGDRAALRPLLSPDVYAAFDAAITARGDTAPLAYAGLKDARIVAASLEQGEAHITLAFTADFAADNQTRQVTDVWTFARRPDSADPNWTLVATSGDLPG